MDVVSVIRRPRGIGKEVRKCEEAMREVLGAGRGVQAGEVEIPAMAAEAGREGRGREQRATR